MHLLIRAVSLAGQPLTQAISAYFDERGGTIGRSDTNTLALPDPERRISRLQAEVSRGADGWRILNVGNANPIWHNNRAVPPGEGVLLDENDELQIGTYALQVSYSKNDATARTITKGRAAVDSRTVIVGSGQEPRTDPSMMRMPGQPFAMSASGSEAAPPAVSPPSAASAPAVAVFGVAAAAVSPAAPAGASPFADLLGASAPAAPSPFASSPVPQPSASPQAASASPFADLLGFGAAPSQAPVQPTATPAAVNRLPDDFDPFADLSPAAPAGRGLGGGANAGAGASWDLPKSPAPAPSASPFDLTPGATPLPGGLDLSSLGQPAGGQSIDQLFGLGSSAGAGTSASADPLAAFMKKTEPAAPAEAAAGTPISMDPLALLSPKPDTAAAPPAPSTPALPDDVPELQAAMPLPPVARPTAPPAPALPADDATFVAPLVASAGPAAGRAHVEATFSFMPAPSAATKTEKDAPSLSDSASSASASSASPFADLGLGTPPKAGLLDDLDLVPQTVPAVHLKAKAQAEADAAGGLGIDLGAPLSESASLVASAESVRAATIEEPPTVTQTPVRAGAPVAAASAATPAQAADVQALWAAFCEGAGIHFAPPQGLNPDLMRVIGQVLRHSVDGSLKLVAARAATKQEMRAEVTVIQARRNNPLKFSPDAQSALEQLLQPPMRGFMSGPEAVSDAMDDLLGHTIGTMVGMRAALEGVLARFEPEQLEAKLVGRSMLDSLLPMNRRAKLWELYLQHYGGVRTEAQDDFHNLFGRAFVQAYEEQLDRLDAERRQQTGHTSAKPA